MNKLKALNELLSDKTLRSVCTFCNGDGLTSEHDLTDQRPEHYNNGDCQTCPVQAQCNNCEAKGYVQDQ